MLRKKGKYSRKLAADRCWQAKQAL